MPFPLRSLLIPALASCAAATARAQTAPAPSAISMPSARVTLRFDSATAATFSARALDFRVGRDGSAAADAFVQLTKPVGPASTELARLGGSSTVVPEISVDLFDSLATPVLSIRLVNATVASDQISLSTTRVTLEQQKIAQQETMSQLTSDAQDADRQLSTLEELGKTRVATRQDIAHARDRSSDIRQRLALLRQRQALLDRQLQATGAVEETVVFRFEQFDLRDAATGATSSVRLPARANPRPSR